MDRLTPFRADEVYFAQRVLASDAAGRRITVELQVAPKRVVEQALATAQRLGLSPARVELAADAPAAPSRSTCCATSPAAARARAA